MKIKDQDRLMCAVKVVLDAEDQLAAVYAEVKPSRETKKAATARCKRLAEAHNGLDHARAELRSTYVDVFKVSRE